MYVEWANEEIKPKGTKNLSLEDRDEGLKDFYTELEKKDDRNCEPELTPQVGFNYFWNEIRKVDLTKRGSKVTTLWHEGKASRPNTSDALTCKQEEMRWKEGRLVD